MKKNIKRICSLMLALVSGFSFVATVSATELPENEKHLIGVYTYEVSADGITPYSSISGYNQQTVTANDNYLFIDCSGSGTGGMGITIETSCSEGTWSIDYAGASVIGNASTISGSMTTNGHVENHNLTQSNLRRYLLSFTVPNTVSSYLVKVWIYG